MYIFLIPRYFSSLPLLFCCFPFAKVLLNALALPSSNHFPVISLDWRKKNGLRLNYNRTLFLYSVGVNTLLTARVRKFGLLFSHHRGTSMACLTCLSIILPIILLYPAFPKFLYSLEAA